MADAGDCDQASRVDQRIVLHYALEQDERRAAARLLFSVTGQR